MIRQNLVLEHLKKHGEITAREMTGPPFYFNCPHRAIKNLKNAGHDIKDEFVTKVKEITDNKGNLKQVKTRFKRYFMEA